LIRPESASAEKDEAVREPSGSIERRFTRPTKPYRNWPRRLRSQTGSVDPVKAAREVDDRFREQATK
jgi:hypothetical protein